MDAAREERRKAEGERRKKKRKRVSRSLTAPADAAFKQAAQKVIEWAAEFGTPVIVWDKDAIQAVEPHKTQPARTKTATRAKGRPLKKRRGEDDE
jgi:hypothetical protein